MATRRKRCKACRTPFYRGGRYCSRACRMIWAEFWVFAILTSITLNARWAGGNGCETMEDWMELAVKRLPESEELLGDVLVDIIEYLQDMEVTESGKEVQTELRSQSTA
jgi:hypothetical protein